MKGIKHEYIGREDDLRRLKSKWRDNKLFGVYGMRSIGKSSFIRHFLSRDADEEKTKVIWCNLRKMTDIERIYLILISELHIDNITNITEHVLYRLWEKINDELQKVRIVFDNAEDTIESKIEQEFNFLCRSLVLKCTNITIILTSTTVINFTELDHIYFKFTLAPMSLLDAKTLMYKYAPSVDFGSYLETVVGLCEGLPLALLMVAAELEDQDSLLSLEDMIQLLMDCRLNILSQDVYPRKERIGVVYGEFLKRLCKKLQDRLSALGYIPGSFSIGQAREMIGHQTDQETQEETLQPVVSRNVVQYDDKTKRYDIHGILRDCIDLFLGVQNLPEVRRRFCNIFSRVLTDIAQKMDTDQYMEALCLYNQERQNFQKLLTDVIYTNEDTYPLYMEVAIKSSNAILQFMAGDGFQFYTVLMTLAKNYGKTIDEACVQIHYGGALTNIKGDIEIGENVYLNALKTLEAYREVNGNVIINSYHGLGNDCRLPLAAGYQKIGWNLGSQGRHKEALRYLEMAYKFENEMNMYNEELALSTIQSLGIFYAAIDNLEKGLHFHEEARKRRLELYTTEEHPFTGGTINNIGIIYRKMGMKDKALKYFQQGLDIKLRNQATDKAIVISMNNVAIALSDLGRHKEAMATIAEAHELLKKHPGLHVDTIALTCTTEGQILFRQKRYVDAVKVFRTVDRAYFKSAVLRRLRSYLRMCIKSVFRFLTVILYYLETVSSRKWIRILFVIVSFAILLSGIFGNVIEFIRN